MADSIYTCKDCGTDYEYYSVRKKRDPRSKTFRTICEACFERVTISLARQKSAGPYNGALGSKGGGASADIASKLIGSAGKDRFRLIKYIAGNGPTGAENAAHALGMDADYASPRLSESVTLGLLRKGPRTARTARGNPAHVYEITEAGLRAVSKAGQGEAA